MSVFDALLGKELLGQEGKTLNTGDAVNGKKGVALYFSAHWCPPCRGFTPKLADAYSKHLQKEDLEIVFVSSDQDEAAFSDYFKTQPWLALPFGDRATKAKLGQKYGVQGIPSLIILDGEGNLVTKDGRSNVMQDPTGKSWIPGAAGATKSASVDGEGAGGNEGAAAKDESPKKGFFSCMFWGKK